MKTYQFRKDSPETQRDLVVIALRRDGYKASRETDTLRTDASLCAIGLLGLPGGAAGVIDIAPLVAEAKREAAKLDAPPVSQIAKQFGCTPQQVRAQFARNTAQLSGMADKAKVRRVNGYTEAELRAMAAKQEARCAS